MHFNGYKLKQCSGSADFNSIVLGQKKDTLEKNDFDCILICLNCRWLQSRLADLEKHKTLAFSRIIDFYASLN